MRTTPPSIALLVLTWAVSAAPAAAATLTRGPYVQLAGPTSIAVAWRTAEATDSVVEYGPDATLGLRASDPGPEMLHALLLEGLSPSTTYHYRILAGDQVLAEGKTFRTAPDPAAPAPFRFIALGDSGGGTQAQLDVAAQLALSQPDLGIHIGDLTYPAEDPGELDDRYFNVYHDTIASVVIYPAIGNKEVDLGGAAPFLEAFYLPENGVGPERTYSFTYGNAFFAALDTNIDISPESEQVAWLIDALARTDRFWRFVLYHHPAYSSGPVDPLLRTYLEPIFNQHRVDLVFQGHTHFYERTFPLAAGAATDREEEPNYVDPQGTIYLVTGGGGGTLIAAAPKEFSARYASTYHHVRVQVDDNVLTLNAIDRTGAVIDTMTITKKKPAPPRTPFHRGDADANGSLQITDPVGVLNYLFLGTAAPSCLETADADDDGKLLLTDPIRVLNFLFLGGPPPEPPGPPPSPCGPDPEGSPRLACESYRGC